MPRLPAAALLVLLLGPPALAEAQSIAVFVEQVEGRDGERNEFNLTTLPISTRECARNVTVDIQLEGIPTSANVIDVWRSTGSQCNLQEERNDEQRTGCEPIDLSVNANINGPEKPLLGIPVQELVTCEAGRESKFTIYFLAANSSPSTEDVGSGWGSLEVRMDTDAPLAPLDIEGRDGEARVGARWDIDENVEMLREHRVYFRAGCVAAASTDAGSTMDAGGMMDAGGALDTGPGADSGTPTDAMAMMDTGALADATPMTDAGGGPDGAIMSLDSGPTLVGDAGALGTCAMPGLSGFTFVGTASGTETSTSIRADEQGIALGSQVTIAITAVDEACNESEPALTCVTRVDTTGFCEEMGECPGGCGCAVPGVSDGPKGPRGVFAALALGLAVMGLGRRRRRR